jgi:hypothetical protein
MGIQLITKPKRNMKNKLMPLMDKLLTRKRSIIETIIDQLKNISQIVRAACRRQTFSASQSGQFLGQLGLWVDCLLPSA